MKISEITTEFLIDYCNAYPEDETIISAFKDAAVSYIRSYTGLTDEELMEMDDITIGLLVLVNSMYDYRGIEADKSNVNVILDSVLSMHSKNLL